MRQAVFMDRDGVLNEVGSKRVRIVRSPDDLYLLPRAAAAVKALNDAGYLVFIVTNQGGIGLGLMNEESLLRIHFELLHRLRLEGAGVDDIAYCPHMPQDGCVCRKPRPGMIVRLAKRYDVALGRSYTVGDRNIDIAAGRAAGTTTVQIGRDRHPGRTGQRCDYRAASLWEAAQWILARDGHS